MSLQNKNHIINIKEEDDSQYPDHNRENLRDQFFDYLDKIVNLYENFINDIKNKINEKFNNSISISSIQQINDIVLDFQYPNHYRENLNDQFLENLDKITNLSQNCINDTTNIINEKLNDSISTSSIQQINDKSKRKQQPKHESISNINKTEENYLLKKENSKTQTSSSHIPEPKPQLFENSYNQRKYFRVEDAKKHFKKAINDYAVSELNRLIKISGLPRKLKRKIHTPNYKLFTSNAKEKDNYDYLNYEFKDILFIGKSDNQLQNFNYSIITQILNNKKIPKDVVQFLRLKYEDIISRFYDSNSFKAFKEKKITQFLCQGIQKEKNISLLEKNGLIKLFKSFEFTKKKRKGKFFVSKQMV